MALTIPTQAIKFVGTGETNFNEQIICGCELNEQWSYLVNDGDDICFQLANGSSIGDDFIVNGSFESGSDNVFTGSDWSRSIDNIESTNVRRMPDALAPCGSYLAYWTNSVETPLLASITQTLTTTPVQGHTYKLTIKSRITNGSFTTNGNANALKITLGGMVFYVTPETSTSFNEYTIIATFVSAPTDNLLVLEINTSNTINVSEMYVDCVTLQEYETCSILGHINNGCFEDGQQTSDAISPTFDNWGGNPSESLTGGYDGGRCVLLVGIGDTLSQADLLLANTNYTIKFWARSNLSGASLELSTTPTSTIIDTILLTTTWTQYSVNFHNIGNSGILFTSNTDEFIYIDCVEVTSLPQIDIYITGGDAPIKISDNDIIAFDGGANVCIAQADYNLPSCFNICVESCLVDLFLNGNFESGTGNVFTSWTLTQPSRTNKLLRSESFNTTWTKTNLTITENAVIAPNGLTVADSLVPTAVNGSHNIQQLVATIAAVGTMYVYAKPNGYNWIAIENGGQVAYFNISTGTVGTVSAGTASIRLDNNGYYLCIFTCTAVNTKSNIYVASANSTITFTGNGTSGVYLWGSQFQLGSYATPYIPTTSATVTTSLGEFLQDATGGIYGDRALQIWADNGSTATYFSQLIYMVNGKEYTLKFNAKIVDSANTPFLQYKIGSGAWVQPEALLSSTYQEYEETFIAPSTGTLSVQFKYTNDDVYGFAMVDEVFLIATEDIVTHCSEDFKYTTEPNPCMKELVWYDSEPIAMGINYSSGFKNRIRVQAQLQNPNYIKEDYVKVLNGETSFINSMKVRKTQDLSIDSVPEFIWDRIATMMGVSNIEYNGIELCSSIDSEITINYDKNTLLYSGGVILSPKGEYITERSYNCS